MMAEREIIETVRYVSLLQQKVCESNLEHGTEFCWWEPNWLATGLLVVVAIFAAIGFVTALRSLSEQKP